MPSMLVTHGHHFGVRFELLDRTTLGRSSNCTFQLLDEKASRLHASITRQGDRWFIKDEGSSNGTGLNGRLLLDPQPLSPGDEVAVGNNLLLFEPRLDILLDLEGAGAVVVAASTQRSASARAVPSVEAATPGLRLEALLARIAEMLEGPRGVGRPAALVEAVVTGLTADRGALLVAPTGGEPMKAVATFPHRGRVTVAGELLRRVLEVRKPMLADAGISDLTVRGGRSVVEARAGFALVIPISRGGRLRGIFYVDSATGEGFRGLDPELLHTVAALAFAPLLSGDPAELRPAPAKPPPTEPVAVSAAMTEVLDRVRVFADDGLPLLLVGEAGSGRATIARQVHRLSARADGPFVCVRCAELADARAEALLFGVEATDDSPPVRGLVERADGGTLFLDDIAHLSVGMQTKLLRLLQEGRFYRRRGTRPVRVDTRIVAGSRRGLTQVAEQGAFVPDLALRLGRLRLDLPPLRERSEDIGPLAQEMLLEFDRKQGTGVTAFSPEAMGLLVGHEWPGNARELKGAVQRLAVVAEAGAVQADDVKEELAALPTFTRHKGPEAIERVAAWERRVTSRALSRAQGNRARAASLLGITRVELEKRAIRFGLDLFGA